MFFDFVFYFVFFLVFFYNLFLKFQYLEESGSHNDSTHDTQVSVAIHSEVVVNEATYVGQLTTYRKPKEEPAVDEKAAEDVPAKGPETIQEKERGK